MYSPRIKESVNNLSRKDIEGFVFGNCGHSFSKTEKNLSVGQQILNNSSKNIPLPLQISFRTKFIATSKST